MELNRSTLCEIKCEIFAQTKVLAKTWLNFRPLVKLATMVLTSYIMYMNTAFSAMDCQQFSFHWNMEMLILDKESVKLWPLFINFWKLAFLDILLPFSTNK